MYSTKCTVSDNDDDILQVHCQTLRCQLWQCKAFLTMLFLCSDLTNNNAKMVTSDEHFFLGGGGGGWALTQTKL